MKENVLASLELNAIRVSTSPEYITLNIGHVADENSTDEQKTIDTVKIDMTPQKIKFLIHALISVAIEYEKDYNVNLGFLDILNLQTGESEDVE